ncbi:MAG: helix-turn-helix domain-containing protein [Beijerinckiaceae bacterium]
MIATASAAPEQTFGDHLRRWRMTRRLSQLDCALDAEISQKHLSFIESGRSRPSREMVLRLAEALRVPLRETNRMMLAAGYAPAYAERQLDDPALTAARAAIELIIKGHEPFPALAVDRRWNLLAANAAVGRLLGLVAAPKLLEPPINVLRLGLDPGGLQPHIANFGEWRRHLLQRLRQQAEAAGDPELHRLHGELTALPAAAAIELPAPEQAAALVIPLQLRTPAGLLSFISTTTVFGAPLDITLSEIALETFYPADDATSQALRAMAGQAAP